MQVKISRLLGDLPVQIIWVDGISWPRVVMGNIYQQNDGSAKVSAGYFANLYGDGGKVYIMKYEGGIWQYAGDTGTFWVGSP
jgi:hypothetical protein